MSNKAIDLQLSQLAKVFDNIHDPNTKEGRDHD